MSDAKSPDESATIALRDSSGEAAVTGIMLRVNGTHEEVSIGRTIDSAYVWYKNNAESCLEGELADLKFRYIPESSEISYTTCIYDCGAGVSSRVVLNQHVPMSVCLGDVLVFKTVVLASASTDMKDKIEDMDMSIDSIYEVLRFFVKQLEDMPCTIERMVITSSTGVTESRPKMFPHILTTISGEKIVRKEAKALEASGFDTDLLTWLPKSRSLVFMQGWFGVGGSTLEMTYKLVKKMQDNKHELRYCLCCKGVVHLLCSRCKKFYWCGSEECKLHAWRIHKPGCKA